MFNLFFNKVGKVILRKPVSQPEELSLPFLEEILSIFCLFFSLFIFSLSIAAVFEVLKSEVVTV